VVMCFGGFIFRGIFRWLRCTVYMWHHLYLVSSIPCVLQGWRLIIFADSKKKGHNNLLVDEVRISNESDSEFVDTTQHQLEGQVSS
jgi:hypothetical protein